MGKRDFYNIFKYKRKSVSAFGEITVSPEIKNATAS